MIATCPTKQELQALSLGTLSDDRSDELFQHLHGCETCQRELQQLDESDDSLIAQLRGVSAEDDFERETECHWASARALAALSQVEPERPTLPTQFGDYEIIRPLGKGGMGQVFLGQHTKLGKPVAIKIIADHRRWDQTSCQRFAAEARAIGQLDHPNIVAAYDAREVDGMAVLITEFVDGLNLSELVQRMGPLSVPQAVGIAIEVCQALTYCHGTGLIHRDIKPSNVMVDRSGAVKLLDLGLARSPDHDHLDLTATGQALGTADYVSPEQVEGNVVPDERTDVYSLGCTLFKLLTGEPPFNEPDHTTVYSKLNAHVSKTPPTIRERRSAVPSGLSKLVEQMLAKQADDRPSVEEVKSRLETWAKPVDRAILVNEAILLHSNDPEQGRGVNGNSKSSTRPQTSSGGSWRRLVWTLLGLAGFAFGLWLGITITVKKPDGTTAQVTIPDGATATIDNEGNVQVTLPDGGVAGKIDKDNVSNASTKPSVGDRKENSQPTRAAASSQPSNTATIELTPSDPLYGKLVRGDKIYVGVLEKSDGKMLTPDRIYGKEVEQVNRTEQGETIRVGRLVELQQNQTYFAALELPSHHRQSFVEQQLFGVWQPSLLLGSDVDLGMESVFETVSLLFFQDKAIVVSENGYHSFKFRKGSEFLSYFVPSVRYGRSSTQRYENFQLTFHDNAVVDFFIKNGSHATNKGFRLKKVDNTETLSKTQQIAFDILESTKNFDIPFELKLGDEGGFLANTTIIDNQDVVAAKVRGGEDGAIEIELTEAGKLKLYLASSKNIGKKLNVFIDGNLHSSPIINSAIGSPFVLHLTSIQAEAKQIADGIAPKMTYQGEVIKFPSDRSVAIAKIQKLVGASGRTMGGAVQNIRTLPTKKWDADNPPISWRVMLLPVLGYDDLWKRYRQDHPWNSEENLKLLSEMPEEFRHPSQPDDTTETRFIGLTVQGDTGFNPNELILTEAKEPVPWTQPDNYRLDDPKVLDQVRTYWKDQFVFGVSNYNWLLAIPRNETKRKELLQLLQEPESFSFSIDHPLHQYIVSSDMRLETLLFDQKKQAEPALKVEADAKTDGGREIEN